ncbi:MAG: hypothetical protein ACYSWQ_05160, partial [Planctomycetota bacterium]
MKQSLFGQRYNGVVFHAEKRRRSTNRVLGIHHDDASLGKLFVFFDKAGHVNLFGEDLVRQ